MKHRLTFKSQVTISRASSETLFVEKTGDKGILLEATRFIPKGTMVLDFSSAVESVQTYQTVQTGKNRHVLDQTLAKLNHSCAPSLIVDAVNSECRAAHDLHPGDELNFFYPSTEWTMDEPFSCVCSSSQCIGQIQGAAFLEAAQLAPFWLNPHIEDQRQSARPLLDFMTSIRRHIDRGLHVLRQPFSLDTADARQ